MTLTCAGVLTHPDRPATLPVAEHIVATLRERGIEVWMDIIRDDQAVQDAIARSNVVVAIGGDGVMLRASRMCAPYGVALLGLNMGRLGFLTEISSPDDWGSHLERLLTDDYWIEKRMMINACVTCDNEIRSSGDALNDVVISGDRFGRIIQLETYIDGTWTTTYNSDALIIATPTGSTAYALAVGGPILPPQVQNILLIPAAPHLSMERPIVLSEGSRVEVRVAESNRHPVVLTLDGAILTTLERGDVLQVRASQYISRFVRMRDTNYFYRSLLDRLEPRFYRGGDSGFRPSSGGNS